jgi:hypothetical protein
MPLQMRRLVMLAWVNVALHALGLVLAAVGMRPGSPLVPLAERMEYLAGGPIGWSLGWGVWMLCSLLLFLYVAALRDHLAGGLAMALTAAGMSVDLLCDVAQIRALPLAAASDSKPLFLTLESLLFAGGATVANGLYSLAVLILTLALGRRIGVLARLSGLGTAVAGAAMAAAGLIPSPRLLELVTGPTIGLYSLWTVLVARDLGNGS